MNRAMNQALGLQIELWTCKLSYELSFRPVKQDLECAMNQTSCIPRPQYCFVLKLSML